MSLDLLTIGDTGIDEFLKVDDANVVFNVNQDDCQICFDYAEKIPVSEFRTSVAGNAANVAVGCAKLGLNSGVYTEIGDDENGDIVKKTLKKNGVDVSLVKQSKGPPTNVHPIIVYKGERTIFSYHAHKQYNLQHWKTPKFIYYTSLGKGFEKFQEELVGYLGDNPDVIVVLNPGSTQMKVGLEAIRKFLKHTDVLFINREEAEKIADMDGAEMLKLHTKLHSMGAKLSIITDSVDGSSSYDGSKHDQIGIYDDGSEVVDKTGAGDTFGSGFLSALFYGKDAKTAMMWGAVNAGSVITQIGSINGLLTKDEIEKRVSTWKA